MGRPVLSAIRRPVVAVAKRSCFTGYREYIGNVARELAEYDIDGLHLDYVRYNHNANGWSEEDFERLAYMGANLDRVKELVETTWGYNGRLCQSACPLPGALRLAEQSHLQSLQQSGIPGHAVYEQIS